jgi:hypothetical protein
MVNIFASSDTAPMLYYSYCSEHFQLPPQRHWYTRIHCGSTCYWNLAWLRPLFSSRVVSELRRRGRTWRGETSREHPSRCRVPFPFRISFACLQRRWLDECPRGSSKLEHSGIEDVFPLIGLSLCNWPTPQAMGMLLAVCPVEANVWQVYNSHSPLTCGASRVQQPLVCHLRSE